MGHQDNGVERQSTGLLLKNVIASRGKAPTGGKGERYLVRVKRRNYVRRGKVFTTTKAAQALEYGGRGGRQPAEPWIRPAFHAKAAEAIHTIGVELVNGIDRVVKKLARAEQRTVNEATQFLRRLAGVCHEASHGATGWVDCDGADFPIRLVRPLLLDERQAYRWPKCRPKFIRPRRGVWPAIDSLRTQCCAHLRHAESLDGSQGHRRHEPAAHLSPRTGATGHDKFAKAAKALHRLADGHRHAREPPEPALRLSTG